VTSFEEGSGAFVRSADIIEEHCIGVDPRNGPGRKYEWGISEDSALQVRGISARWHQDDALDPPAEMPLATYPVVIENGRVIIEVPDGPLPVNE